MTQNINLIFLLICFSFSVVAFSSKQANAMISCPTATGASGVLLNVDADYNTCINGAYTHPVTGFSGPSNGFKVTRYNHQPNFGFPNIFPLSFIGYYQTEQNWQYTLDCSGSGCVRVYGNWVYCEGNCDITFRYRRSASFQWSILNCTAVASQTPRLTSLDCSAKGGMFYQAGDDNSQLSNLLLSTGGLSPTFMSTTYNYTHSTNSTFATFTPTASNPSASISVHGNPVVSGSASAAVPLVIGANPINTIVTALDGSTTNYIVTITRLSSSPISLNNISKFVDDPPFNITNPPSLSSGAFSYTSSDTSVATISGNTVTIQGLGASTITVTQAAAGSYVSATTTATLTVTENLNDPVVAFEAIKTEIESITKNGTISNSVEQVKNAEFIMREKMVFHGEMMRAEPSTATTSFVDYNFNFNGDSFGIVGAGKYHQTDIGGDQFRRRIMIDAKRVHSKNQSVTQVVSALSLFDVGISEKTSSQYRFGFKQSDGKGNHPITSSSNARSYRVGGSLSHSFNEKVFGGVFGDFIYTRTKSSFQSTYTNVIGKIRTYSVSGGAQLAGQYEVYAEFWIKPSVALSYSREHLIKKRFISTTSLGSTVVEAALPMPTVLRITIEPEFLYESSANHNKTKDFASVNPSYACESIKSRDKVDVCNTGIYFQIGRKSDEKGITGKFYFSYENLNSGPKHEYGLQFKANL